MRGNRGLLHNLSILSAGQIASQGLNVLALVFLADNLGPHWFGVVQIGVTVMAYALITAEWGMMSLGIREISRLDCLDAVHTYAREHLGLLTLQTFAVALLAWLIVPRLRFFVEDPFVFRAYVFSIFPQIFMVGWVAVGLERMTWVGAAKTGRALFYALFILLLWKPMMHWTGWPGHRLVPLFFLAAMLMGNLTIGIPMARWFGRPLLPKLPALSEARRRWGEALPLGSAIIVLRVLLNIDIIMLGILAVPTMA